MSRTAVRSALAVAAVAGVGVWLAIGVAGQPGAATTAAMGQPSTSKGDWPLYTADVRGSKYSPLDQIDAKNFNNLEVAWRFKTDNLGSRPEFKLEGTPLAVNGILYTTAGTRRAVVALDGRTGELIWVHSYREGKRSAVAPRQLSGRGVSYWTDGQGDDRVLYVTVGYRLIELNAKDGSMVKTFGDDGVVDLKAGMVTGSGQQIDLETGEAGLHSTPTVVGDVVIVGSSFQEGMTVKTHNNTKGLVRAFDVRTGKLLWTFHTIPRPGEFGNDTWLNDSWKENGNAGVWTQITVDPELGLVYLPVEDPTSDFYGGSRPGNNLYGDSLVCVDLKTGERKWFFQIVHHPIWDYDLSSAPLLADVTIDGKLRKVVALPTKEAFLYVFDRVTGEPIWPIEERPAPKGEVPGEWYSPTQPFPTKPPAYARQSVGIDDLIDFTPQMRQEAIEITKRYKLGPMFNPPTVSDRDKYLGGLTIGTTNGGTNWPGAGYDPELHTVFAQASNSSLDPIGLIPPPPGFSDLRYVAGTDGRPFRVLTAAGFGTNADAADRPPRQAPPPKAGAKTPPPQFFSLNVDGLPLVKPPYGTLSAISLENGTITWQVPHGDTPDVVRNHPALKGMNISKTGQRGSVGVLITKTLVVAGDPEVTTTSEHPRGAMMRAYDKATGKQVGAVWMPAAVSGSPMTYLANGKQYVVIAVSGGPYSGEYLSFALPRSEQSTTSSAASR